MNNHFSNFIQSLRGIRLSDASYTRIRSTLSSYADLHTVPDGVPARAPLSPYLRFFSLSQVRYGTALTLLIVFIGGGVASGAEKATPGDTLYAIKVNVNEKVGAVLADTPEERAELSTKLATRRVDEGLTLLAEGKLDADTAQYLDTEVALHVDASNAAADTLESEGDIAGSLAVRTELAEKLAERVAVLDAGAVDDQAEDAAPAVAVMLSAKSAPAPIDPRAQFTDGLRARAMQVAEARIHTAAALLPGIAEAVDLDALHDDEVVEVAADTDADTATSMVAAEVAATTTAETFEAKAKYAPMPNNAWSGDEMRPFWQGGTY